MRIRFFVLLTCLLFSSEYKASISLDSNMARVWVQRKFFLKKAVSKMNIQLPLSLKIKFRTPYIFDLEFQQDFVIVFGRNESRHDSQGGKTKVQKPYFFLSDPYACKNEYTSFITCSSLKVSKRKMIKTIYERVVFCFDFSIPFLFFNVALLTKEAGEFKFFHAPECENEEDEWKRGRSFAFFSFPFFFTDKWYYSSYWFAPFCGDKVKRIVSNLYPFACLFSFSFDIFVCSYLSCRIKIPFNIVFFFFLPFTYLSLNKECKNEEKGKIKGNKDVPSDNEKKLQSIIPLAIDKILSLFSFSIGLFDSEEIEE